MEIKINKKPRGKIKINIEIYMNTDSIQNTKYILKIDNEFASSKM